MTTGLFEIDQTATSGRFSWTPSPLLLTPAGNLQGGAGLGAAATAMEQATGRPVIWTTAQYLSFATGLNPVDIDITIEVTGYNTTQARSIVSRDGREILNAHAALGRRDFEIEGVWCPRPSVPPPGECPRFASINDGGGGLREVIEFRLARGRQIAELTNGPRGDGWFALWCRCWHGARVTTIADLAFIGDFMPMGFADAVGAHYAGNSLDNTIRTGQLVETEWVLLSIHVQQIANGFGYGRAELWSENGTLLGEVSQSAVLRSHETLSRRHRP